MKLASFDIFDRVLICECGFHHNIFNFMSYNLYTKYGGKVMCDVKVLKGWSVYGGIPAKKIKSRSQTILDNICR